MVLSVLGEGNWVFVRLLVGLAGECGKLSLFLVLSSLDLIVGSATVCLFLVYKRHDI